MDVCKVCVVIKQLSRDSQVAGWNNLSSDSLAQTLLAQDAAKCDKLQLECNLQAARQAQAPVSRKQLRKVWRQQRKTYPATCGLS